MAGALALALLSAPTLAPAADFFGIPIPGTAPSLPPPLDLTLADSGESDLWAGRLNGVSLMPGHLRLPRGADVASLPGYDEGRWWVQDLAASIPARLLGQGEGRRILDLCAAPGGKTMQLASVGADVIAVEREPVRAARLRENLARTKLNATVVESDMRDFTPDGVERALAEHVPAFKETLDVLNKLTNFHAKLMNSKDLEGLDEALEDPGLRDVLMQATEQQ